MPRRPGVPLIVAINKIDKADANPDRVRAGAAAIRDPGRVARRRDAGNRGLGQDRQEPRLAARGDRAAGRTARSQGQSRPRRGRHRHRGQARSRSRPGGDRARPARHAAHRRHRRGRRRMGPCPRADRRHRRAGEGGSALHAGRGARLQRHARGRRPRRGGRVRGPCPRDHRLPRASAPRPPAARGAGSGAGRSLGRDDARAQGRRRPQGVPARRQGRRAGLRRGHRRLARRRSATTRCAPACSPSGVGAITRSDVTLAAGLGRRRRSASTCVPTRKRARRPSGPASRSATTTSSTTSMDDVKDAMSGLLAPTLRETMLGNAQILEIFNVSKVGKIAGCRVTDGTIERGANVRLIRDNVVVHEGKLGPAQALQGRRQGSGGRPGMRHVLRELPGHARRRRDRVLSASRRSSAGCKRLRFAGMPGRRPGSHRRGSAS